MSRYDKYNGVCGGFRAPLAAAWNATTGPASVTDLGRILCIALNGSGQIIKAASAAACRGVVIVNQASIAGDVVDVMTAGQIVEVDGNDFQSGSVPAAGALVFYDTAASRLTTTPPTTATVSFQVGTMVEATRLVVNSGVGVHT